MHRSKLCHSAEQLTGQSTPEGKQADQGLGRKELGWILRKRNAVNTLAKINSQPRLLWFKKNLD